MKVTQYSEGCGALISDIQLADLSVTQLADLRTIFAKHGLLFFRDQDFSPQDHLQFAQRFGSIVVNKFLELPNSSQRLLKFEKKKINRPILVVVGIQTTPMMIFPLWGLYS